MSDCASPASFRVGPPSPSSPATGSLKENHPPYISSENIPQTPTSPPLMSVSAQSYATNIASSQPTGQATSQPANLSSPPSSAPMSTQTSQQPAVGMTNSFPTPASSVSGQFMGPTSGDDLEHAEKSFGHVRADASANSAVDMSAASTQQSEHRRTDHDRDLGGPIPEIGVRDFACMDGQISRNDTDAMDIDRDVNTSSNSGGLDLESLQQDFSSAFHLCKSSYVSTGPDPTLDLISLYGLGPVAKSVARMDPVTGEKINRLRKSYEGKLKGLGLAGRNKPVKHEPNTPGGLRHLTMWPEEEWQNQKVYGKEIKVADINSALYNLQMKAMQMEPGTVPNNEFWEDVLGHEKPSKHAGHGEGKKASVPPSSARSPSQPNVTRVSAEPERPRPSRGRKRHYDDNSFVGYGEGYADDDDEGAFYSNSEGIGKKKRKKDHVSKVSTPLPDRGGSYGVGMFGIGAR